MADDENATYRVVRFYSDKPGKVRILRGGLTLEEAQAHCRDPETSSSTSKRPRVKRAHARGEMWFDGYEDEKKTKR